jgi:outer membrane protein OmpA-like peptidoglycan-associated protein
MKMIHKIQILFFLTFSLWNCKLYSQNITLNKEEYQKASLNGKYSNLIQVFSCSQDAQTYGNFKEYGYWSGTTWCNQSTKTGYWVWVSPKWYIWSNLSSDTKPVEKTTPKKSTNLFGNYNLLFRCNDNTSQEVVFNLDIPKNSTNKYTIKSNSSGIENNKTFNCVATFEYSTTTNILSGNVYMTKPSDRKFFRNDKFKIQFDGNDSGWFNLEMGDHYDAKCIAEGRLVKVNPCSEAPQKLDFHVPNVPVIPQPNHYTCWAASAAMMHWWHEKKKNYSISEALYDIEGGNYKFHQTFLLSNDIFIVSGGGIDGGEPQELYLNKMGLQTFSKPTDISQFNSYLKEFGPILMVRHSKCSNIKYQTGHVMVMTGIHSDGNPECTYFDIIDPWAWNEFDQKIQVKEELWSYDKLFECDWDFAYYPIIKKPKIEIPPVNKPVVLKNVFFEITKPTLLPNSFVELDKLSELMLQNSSVEIQLEGHTDKGSDNDADLKLSNERVEVVKQYLVTKGINANRIVCKGFGNTKLLYPSPNQENRRVQFLITKQ